MTLEDCQNSDCNCCVFLSRRAGAVCKTDHIRMDNEEELWGTAYFMDINSNFITIFNATPEQIEIIRTTLSVLPAGYLAAVPISIRIGNPRNGSKTVRSGGTVGGGSRRCNPKSPDYEYIIIHPDAFDRGQSPRMTILHEVGHFVDREYQLSASLVGEYADEFSDYLSTYRGDSRGNDEVIAQGIAYYINRKYFTNTGQRTGNAWAGGRLPEWLYNIIHADIQTR